MVYDHQSKSSSWTPTPRKSSFFPPAHIQTKTEATKGSELVGTLPSKAQRDKIRRSLFGDIPQMTGAKAETASPEAKAVENPTQVSEEAMSGEIQGKAETGLSQSQGYGVPSREVRNKIRRSLFGNLEQTPVQKQEEGTSPPTPLQGEGSQVEAGGEEKGLAETEISLPIQAKLTIGEPNDKYEQEADRVARQVVDKIHSPTPETVQREEMGDEDEVRLKSDARSGGKVEAGVGVTGVRMSPIEGVRVNRKVNSEGETQEASAQLEASIQGKRGSGQPLDESVKEPMEGAFGADFSGVRVHTDAKSDELNQAIQAKAFTTGEDIFFREGAYEPGSRGGQELLAHELTHVVQQKGDSNRRFETKKEGNLQDLTDTSGREVVQRNGESKEALQGLAQPKVGGQNAELVQSIHDKIEKIYNDTINLENESGKEKDENKDQNKFGQYNGAVCLGGILLPSLKEFKSDIDELAKSCKFVNLGKGSVTRGIYSLLNEELKKDIVKNTLNTMLDAGQLQYLSLSNFGKDESTWKVVVEVHYYRERLSLNNVFHKDTMGQTLFVNLNYLNDEQILGPEYVINPMDHPTHLKQLAERLPEEFLQDRESVMSQLDEPEIIEVVEIPEYGYVAFVDEIINHSSPTTKHREVSGKEVHKYLREKNEKDYEVYKKAYMAWKERGFLWWLSNYTSYLDENYHQFAGEWKQIFNHIKDEEKEKYDRQQLLDAAQGGQVLNEEDVKILIHQGGYKNFGQASIPNPDERGNSIKREMTKNNRPLKRKMSENLQNKGGIPGTKGIGGRRSFFRTWVRAEKAENVKGYINENWKWTNK